MEVPLGVPLGIVQRQKLSKEEYEKQKVLEEKRRKGIIPHARDTEGNIVNPYIPNFIAKAPWYADSGDSRKEYLQHQRSKEQEHDPSFQENWYKRGAKVGPAATKFRKGACENCGAISHKTKECMERPRKQGAKWTGKGIAADEYISKVDVGFEGKRDRWNGYDPRDHQRVVETYERAEKFRETQKLVVPLDSKEADNDVNAEKAANDENEDLYGDDMDQPGQGFDTAGRISARNLRIREDTARYLRKTEEGGEYNPKSRGTKEIKRKRFDEEANDGVNAGFQRPQVKILSKDANEFNDLQLFAYKSNETNETEFSAQANPTETILRHKEFLKKGAEEREKKKNSIIEKYGADVFTKKELPQELLISQEDYIEYDENGKLISSGSKTIPRSRYQEDIYLNNHTSIFGSWYCKDTNSWGYKCCHSITKNSYCTGEEGIKAMEESKMVAEEAKKKFDEDKKSLSEMVDPNHNKRSVKPSMIDRVTEESLKQSRDDRMSMGINEEEIEQYKRNRVLAEDPMASYVNKN